MNLPAGFCLLEFRLGLEASRKHQPLLARPVAIHITSPSKTLATMITIVDYQMGNLRSVQKGIERVGGHADHPFDLNFPLRLAASGLRGAANAWG